MEVEITEENPIAKSEDLHEAVDDFLSLEEDAFLINQDFSTETDDKVPGSSSDRMQDDDDFVVTARASPSGSLCPTVLPSSQQRHRIPASLDLQTNQDSRVQDASQLPVQHCQSFPQHQDDHGCKKVSSRNLTDLLKATKKISQLKAIDFINISNFASDNIDSKNVNLIVFGSLKLLL